MDPLELISALHEIKENLISGSDFKENSILSSPEYHKLMARYHPSRLSKERTLNQVIEDLKIISKYCYFDIKSYKRENKDLRDRLTLYENIIGEIGEE